MFKRSGVVTPMNVLKKVKAVIDIDKVKKEEEEEKKSKECKDK